MGDLGERGLRPGSGGESRGGLAPTLRLAVRQRSGCFRLGLVGYAIAASILGPITALAEMRLPENLPPGIELSGREACREKYFAPEEIAPDPQFYDKSRYLLGDKFLNVTVFLSRPSKKEALLLVTYAPRNALNTHRECYFSITVKSDHAVPAKLAVLAVSEKRLGRLADDETELLSDFESWCLKASRAGFDVPMNYGLISGHGTEQSIYLYGELMVAELEDLCRDTTLSGAGLFRLKFGTAKFRVFFVHDAIVVKLEESNAL